MLATLHDAPDAVFARLLRHFRLLHGLTQEQLAEASHLSVAAIRRLENGSRRYPRTGTVLHIAEALNLSPWEQTILLIAVYHHLLPFLTRVPKDIVYSVSQICPEIIRILEPVTDRQGEENT